MNIVVLDGHTLKPGDLDWSALQQLGACTIYDRSTAEQIVPRAKNVELVLTNKMPLNGATLAELPKLRCIGVLATSYNVVDVPAAMARDCRYQRAVTRVIGCSESQSRI